MEVVTTTDVRRKAPEIYNSVQSQGVVELRHRDRPDMLIMTKEFFEKAKRQK